MNAKQIILASSLGLTSSLAISCKDTVVSPQASTQNPVSTNDVTLDNSNDTIKKGPMKDLSLPEVIDSNKLISNIQ